MPLTPGTRLGPYEIVAPLGAGGMGEVYRAKDSRLGREVAVKVLPQHLSENAEVRARFEREAKTVSSLNHPNICTLFDVGREGGTDYLVMELIEGETLAQRLGKGPLPMPDVLKLGAQIADALDRAHRAGVIHRDLKPGNVMLTKSGAKLMDFGLARATGMAGAGSSSSVTRAALTQSPTMAQALTAEGTIVGTFQYMPPEQLEGGEADARSDLWALGCVLYEMSTGRRAFEGRSQASLISAIMSSEPASVSQVAPTSPPALDRLVAACLTKDPADRVQSAHDVRLQLQWMSEPGSQSAPALVGAATTARARNATLLTRAALAAGMLGLAAAGWMGYAQSARKSPVMRLQVPAPDDLALAPYSSFSAISPNGQQIVATANRGKDGQKLWLWTLDAANPVELAGTEVGYSPAWSPDGRSIAYFSSAGAGLFRLPIAGGSPTKLCAAPDARGVSWGSKDILVFAPSASGPLSQVAASGGVPSPATTLDSTRGESAHRFPFFLPDGEHFLFTTLPEGPRGFPVFVGSLGSKKVKHLMDAGCAPIFAEPGYLVFVQGGNVTAQRFDTRRLELVGEPKAIGDAPAISEFTAEPVASASRNDRLLIERLTSPRSKLEWLDRRGSSLSTIALPEGDWLVRALAPDQRSAIATRARDVWRVDLDRAVATRIVRDAWNEVGVGLSPDGRRLALDPGRAGGDVVDLYSVGGGAPEKWKTTSALFQDVADWAPDGSSLIMGVLGDKSNQGEDTSWDLWTVPLTGGGVPAPYVRSTAVERYARISPDGRWLLYVTIDSGQLEIFVDSYPVPGHRLQVLSAEPERTLRLLWGRGGREVLYSDSHGDLISLPVEPAGDELRPGEPTRLFTLPEGLIGISSRDGERFLVSRPSGSTPGPALQLTIGWSGLLAK